jgi:hypothetical protein
VGLSLALCLLNKVSKKQSLADRPQFPTNYRH